MTHHLPCDYQPQQVHSPFIDTPNSLTYQPHVYELAIFIARRCGARRIIDIGCGSGNKLVLASDEFSLLGVDCAPSILLFRATHPNADWLECDLDSTVPAIPTGMLSEAVVICADVIEHLRHPERLAAYLAEISSIAAFVLISTPDRDRVRGWLDRGPPANPTHVQEWGAAEFLRFLTSSGIPAGCLYGHTINTSHHWANTTLLVIAGRESHPLGQFEPRRVAAVIHAYNEADIIPEVVRHLAGQGVQIHLYDNWSSDGTWDVACQLKSEGLLQTLKRYPAEPTNEYQWALLLQHTEHVADSIDADWVIHYDADELRYSPWPGVSLTDAISWIDHLGYNAIDFTVIDFRFLVRAADATSPYESSLTHFEFGRRSGHFVQVKAWKKCRAVRLAESGGHEAHFEGRRIFPLKFLTKHYPLRNPAQANRKVFGDRLPRIQREQSERGWHTQYNRYAGVGHVNGWGRNELLPWAERHFQTEYLVQRLSGIGLQDSL